MSVEDIIPLPFNGDEIEPGMLVRAFSMEVKARCEDQPGGNSEIDESLVQDLADKERRRIEHIQKIQDYLEATRPSELEELNRQKQALQVAVKEFGASVQKSYPEGLHPRLNNWEDVKFVVERVRERLERKQDKSKFRRFTGQLRTFANGVQKHSTALKMLPSNSEYISVFYGALTTVIQASENYTKVMDFMPQSLIEINDAVSAIEKRLWLFDSDTMKSYAWRMYGQIFSFLAQMIGWYTKRSIQRLYTSFNECLPEFFEDQLQEIKKTAALIHQDAEFRAQATIQVTQLYMEVCKKAIVEVSADMRTFEKDMMRIAERELEDRNVIRGTLEEMYIKVKRADLGHAVSELLEGEARQEIKERVALQLAGIPPETGRLQEQEATQEPDNIAVQDPPKVPLCGTSRDGVLSKSATLEVFFDREKVQLDYESSRSFFTDPAIVARMQEWATTTESGVLYIAGTEDSAVWSVSAQYAAVARESHLPVCSYFCSLRHEDPPEGRTRETMELNALVYSLIRQLIELLPTSIAPGKFDFGEASFDSLEGTLDSLPHALKILDSLLSSTGHTIIILVLDSLDVLEDTENQSTTPWLKEFVELILRHVNRREDDGILKVLFTSRATSFSLLETLEASAILLTDVSESPRRNRSRQSLEPLMF